RWSPRAADEVGERTEPPREHLVVGKPDGPDSPCQPESLVLPAVLRRVMARSVDLDDKPEFRKVEVRDAVTRRVKAVLEPIGKAERSEVRGECFLGGRCLLLQLRDKNGVLFRLRKCGEWNPVHACHVRSSHSAVRLSREKEFCFVSDE